MIWTFSSADARKAYRARETFVAALKIRAPKGTDYGACEAIFGELIGNVVRHAPGPIEVRLDWTQERALLSVRDSGDLFDFDPHLPHDPMAENGRGLFIISRLVDAFHVERFGGNGKVVKVALPLQPAAGGA